MKFLAVVTVLSLAAICLSNISGQPRGDQLKHVILVSKQGTRGSLNGAAVDVVTGANFPSIAHLKGNVEIRANGFILHAEQVDFDEDTGEIKASGNVSVMPYPALDNYK